jgi:hypothetical protein
VGNKYGQCARLFHCCFLVLAAAFLYLIQFRLPFTPIFTGGDENLLLPDATRMLEGQIIYRDFFELVTPGLAVTNLGLFKLFGVRVWIPEISLLLLGLGLASLITLISQKVLRGPAVYLPSVLFLTCAFGFGLDDTHHWYSALCELGAVAVILEKRPPVRILAAGALCGLASFFMQTQGVFAATGISIFLIWDGRRAGRRCQEISKSLGCLFASFGAAFLATSAYFIHMAGLSRFLYCVMGFSIKYWSAYRQSDSLYSVIFEFRSLLGLDALPGLGIFLFIHALLPLVYVWFWMRYRKQASKTESAVPLMLLSIVGFLQFLGLASAPTTFRLFAVAPLGLILLVWLLRGQTRLSRISTGILWAVAIGVAIVLPLRIQSRPVRYLDLPRGRVAVDNAYYESLLWWSQHTRPGDFVFTASGTEILFPLALRIPAEVNYVTNTDFTRPDQVRNIVAALAEKQVRFVLWDSVANGEGTLLSRDIPSGPIRASLRGAYRALKTFMGGDYLPTGDHLGPLRDYLNAHYHIVKSFPSSLEVWERNN